MESAFAWLGQIFNWLGQWIPRWEILDMTEGAIKYKGGKHAIDCGPGIHFWWPARSTFLRHPVARQTDRLETQTIETTDGKTFIVAGTITYAVKDLLTLMTTNHSPTTTIVELSASAVHDICCQYTWDELQAKQRRGTLRTELKNEALKQLRGYGVEVIKLQLTSLARARVLKVSQSVSNEET